MIFNQMEFLFSIDFCYFTTNVEFTKISINFLELLFNIAEERSAIEWATDRSVPVAAVLPEEVLIFVEDELVVAVALGDKKHEFIE